MIPITLPIKVDALNAAYVAMAQAEEERNAARLYLAEREKAFRRAKDGYLKARADMIRCVLIPPLAEE